MTEAEWLSCTNPIPILFFLRDKAGDRKLRLTACAYCRSIWRLMGKASRRAVLLGEQMADESVDESHREAVVRAAIEAVCRFEDAGGDFFMAADMAYRVPCNSGWYAVEWTIANWVPLASSVPILRDIFGNLFHPVCIDPTWRTWHDGLLVSMARRMYDSRDFSDMPVLADALEEAGCQNADILAHCRSGGEHVRGCWVVDALLDKS